MGFLLPLFVAATERGPEAPSKPEAALVWKQRSWQYALSLALSPDAEMVALFGDQCPKEEQPNIRLMRLDGGQVMASFAQCTWPIEAGAFSPDGKFLAVGGYAFGEQACRSCRLRQALVIWRVLDGVRVVEQLWAPDGEVSALAFSPDGQYLAVAGSERQQGKDLATEVIKIFRVADWQLLRAIQLPKGPYERPIRTLAFSPDGKSLAAAGEERAIRLWRVENGKLVRLLPGHYDSQFKGDYVRSLAFSPDGLWLASAASDEVVKIWRVADGKLQKRLSGAGSLVNFSKDGRYLLSASPLVFYGYYEPDPEASTEPSKYYQEKRDTSPFPAARLWKVGEWSLVAIFPPMGDRPEFVDLAVNWEKGLLFFLMGDAVIVRRLSRDQPSQKRVWFASEPGDEISLAFSPDGQVLLASQFGCGFATGREEPGLLCGFLSSQTSLWDTASGRLVEVFPQEYGFVRFFAKDRLVAGDEFAGVVLQWPGFKAIAEIPECHLIAVSPVPRLVACGENGPFKPKVHIWRVEENQLRLNTISVDRQNEGDKSLWGLALTPDGKWLAATTSAGFVKLWWVADGQLVHRLKAEGSMAWSLEFSPDSKLLAFSDCQVNEARIVQWVVVKLWDIENQRLIGAIVPEEKCSELAFSPDGQLLACWGFEAPSVTLYRIPDGTVAFSIPEQAKSVAFSPDGRFFAVAGPGSLSLWRLPKMN
jgi:WD40 repeat protein